MTGSVGKEAYSLMFKLHVKSSTIGYNTSIIWTTRDFVNNELGHTNPIPSKVMSVGINTLLSGYHNGFPHIHWAM